MPTRRLLALFALVSGCTSSEVATRPEPARASTPPAPVPTPVAPTVAPTVDLATVTSVRFRISAIVNPGWAACGVLHMVGALEVEVLDVGEPPPRMIVLVSCPADYPERIQLAVGEVFSAELYARAQPWPGVRDLPPDLPRRHLKQLEPAPGG